VINRHLHTVDALSIVTMQRPFVTDQQLTGFDHRATTIDQ